MPGKLSFDDLDLREEPERGTPTPGFCGTFHCTASDACSDICSDTRYC